MKNLYIILVPVIVGISLGILITNNVVSDSVNNESLLTITRLMDNGSPILGNPNASITLVEFGDYQCTFCYKFHQNTLNDIQIIYIDTGKVNYVYRDFPLNGPSSILAAEASYCAGEQDKYWQYHNLIFKNWAGENTGWITMNLLMEFATQLNLDMPKFDSCMNMHKFYQRIIDNESFAKQIGVNATPSFLIFDDEELVRIIGAQKLERFQYVIDELLSK